VSSGRPTLQYVEAMLRRLATNGLIEHVAVAVKMAGHPAAYSYVSTASDTETRAMLALMDRAYMPIEDDK
jgi:hypothetical protein